MKQKMCQHEWVSGNNSKSPIRYSPGKELAFKPGTYIVRETIEFGEGNILIFCPKCREIRSIRSEELEELSKAGRVKVKVTETEGEKV